MVTVEGHRLELTNLDKVLYPDAGMTKAEVIHYYAQVAPVLLPHLAGRPVTLRRFPDGVDGPSFFEKNAARSAPAWVQSVDVPRIPASPRSRGGHEGDGEDIHYVLICDQASLVWAANLAALELHTPMWRATGTSGVGPADLMVFDLDPGAPAAVADCCTVGLWLRDALADAGHPDALAKTSGSKGLQLYVPLEPARPSGDSSAEAHRIARALERAHPDAVVSNMRKDLRKGKVLIDWSQNSAAKTTVAPYSLRARPRPTVSTPVSWDEVEAGARGSDPLVFEHTDVLRRIEELGDLFAALTGEPAA